MTILVEKVGADRSMTRLSVFDLFKIGIGPSSSHTVGPIKAAALFLEKIALLGRTVRISRIQCSLHGSLGATGKGHGSDIAVMLGLMGETPEDVDVELIPAQIERVREQKRITLGANLGQIHFDPKTDLIFITKALAQHPNGIRFIALDSSGSEIAAATYLSVGGGFVRELLGEDAPDLSVDSSRNVMISAESAVSFQSADELLALSIGQGKSISELMREHERTWFSDSEIDQRLLSIWSVMQSCVNRGCQTEGVLPGGFKVRRRAASLFQQLTAEANAAHRQPTGEVDPLRAIDWINLFALAVGEENAAGGRVVTAPTNGAAGIIPAVLCYYMRFIPNANDAGVIRFFLTAAAIGFIYKMNASISGAEVGCQGEVGVACSMAAGALCEVLGGTPRQVENAAEIAMEHHLGLTCDPVGGLVQIPCIERNAVGAVKAVNAARMALRGDGIHTVSLDKVIKTMSETGADMKLKYKETARGGLAVNIVEC
jgi:L-serine dehydratase